MNKIELLIPTGLAKLQDTIIGNYLKNGFEDIVLDASKNMESISLSLAVLEPKEPEIFMKVGYRIGKQIPMILISENEINLPAFASKIYYMSKHDNNFDAKLMEFTNRILKIEKPHNEILGNFDKLVGWLAEDNDRINKIDESSFELLVAKLLENYGFIVSQEKKYGREDLWCYNHPKKLKYLIQCKISQKGQPIGIEIVNQVRNVCELYNSNFSFLITNTNFTRAAKHLADQCYPSIYLFELDHIKSGIRDYINKRHKNDNQLYKLIEQRISAAFDEQIIVKTNSNLLTNNLNIKSKKLSHIYDLCFLSSNKIYDKHWEWYNTFINQDIFKNVNVNYINTRTDKNFSDWGLIFRNSKVILLFMNYENETIDSYDRRLLNLLAQNYDPEKNDNTHYIIISNYKDMDIYNLPICLKNAAIINQESENFSEKLKNILYRISPIEKEST